MGVSHVSIIRLEVGIQYMPPRYGNGSQKEARRDRVRQEVIKFVKDNPGSSAQSIVAYLSVDVGLRNHGLTPRKIGFFIPRYCPEVTWYQDHAAGRRVYAAKESNYAQNRADKIRSYAEHRTGPHTPKPQVGLAKLAERASQSAADMSAAKANHATTATAASTSRAASMARGNLGGTSSRSDTGLGAES